MQEILLTIAERCHAAATKRGKDTTSVGCIQSLRMELREYWKATDRATETPEFDEIIEKTGKLSDEDFAAYYEANLHNTAADELADILIVAATWLWEAKAEAGGNFKPEHIGQINFYLEALDRDVKKPNENPSVGVILCAGKDSS